MVREHDSPIPDDFEVGLGADLDAFFSNKTSDQIPLPPLTDVWEKIPREFRVEQFLMEQCEFFRKDIRSDAQNMYKAFPIWQSRTIALMQKSQEPISQEAIEATRNLTLEGVAKAAQKQHELFIKKKVEAMGTLGEKEANYQVEIWAIVQQTAQAASEIRETE